MAETTYTRATAMRSIVWRRLGWPVLLTLVAAAATSITAFAQTENSKPAAAQAENEKAPATGAPTADAEKEEHSPWMLVPIFSNNPKLGTSIGALAGYINYFDEKSRPSIFALQGQYSSTDSIVSGLLARISFDEDRQRLITGLVYGYVKNDYDDYLGTGVPLKSNGELRSFFARYLYRVRGNWFVGPQGIYQNVAIDGKRRSTMSCWIRWVSSHTSRAGSAP